MSNYRTKTISGVIWNFTEKLSVRLGQFVISIILARLLSPDDFGLIAIVMFFLNVSQIFIESGFSKALIQKTDRSKEDYSSVFVLNLGLSALLYLVLFVAAPFIASFYSEPALTSLIRVLSLTLVVNSLVIVQNVMLQVSVDFKKLAKINIISVVASGIVGIVFALQGFGVWSLVIQSLVRSVINFLLFEKLVHWKKSFVFSWGNIKELWAFSFNLLIASVLSEITHSIYNLLIGKYFSVRSLGYYHRANNFSAIASDTVTQAIQQVTFPILSQLKDNTSKMVSSYIRMMRMSAFVIFPVMALLSALAEPIVKLLLTDEWLPVIPLLQWMAFTRLLYPLHALNLNILNATGRSDLFLKVDVSKLPITIIALVITLPLGVKAMVIGQVVCSPLYFIVNTIMPGRLYGYHFFKQVKDIFPFVVATVISYALTFYCVQNIPSLYLQLIIGGAVGGISYLLVCKLMRVNEINEIVSIIKGVR